MIESNTKKLKGEILEFNVLVKSVPDELSDGQKDQEETILKESLIKQDENLKALMAVT